MLSDVLRQWLERAGREDSAPSRALALDANAASRRAAGLLCGSFNPWHAAHDQIAEIAEELLSGPTDLELTIRNADKPSLDASEVQRRLAQDFRGRRLWLSNVATFAEKALLFGPVTFVVGADTFSRVGDMRFYQHDRTRLDAAIRELAGRGCRFLVFARGPQPAPQTLASVHVPRELKAIATAVPARCFLSPLSSSAIRNASGPS